MVRVFGISRLIISKPVKDRVATACRRVEQRSATQRIFSIFPGEFRASAAEIPAMRVHVPRLPWSRELRAALFFVAKDSLHFLFLSNFWSPLSGVSDHKTTSEESSAVECQSYVNGWSGSRVSGSPHFGELRLGCIEASFCDQIVIFQHFRDLQG